jgi:hypothetical protein
MFWLDVITTILWIAGIVVWLTGSYLLNRHRRDAIKPERASRAPR